MPISRALLPGVMSLILCSAVAQAQTPTAVYEVEFEATWTAATHPVDFPPGPHFSPLVGATHDSGASFWLPGVLATVGIEDVAELGATPELLSEIAVAILSGDADQSIVGSGVSSPSSTAVTFTASEDFPLLTLVTMIAPSPDWFTGVHDLSLMDQGNWIDDLAVDLFPYDSGTDDGVTYLSPNAESAPHVPIALITGGPLGNGVPVGRYVVTRIDRECSDGFDNDGDGEVDFVGGDPGCDDALDDSEQRDPSEGAPFLPCDDGVDNDTDGRTDFDPVTKADPSHTAGVGDPGCASPTWALEDPQCQDGSNNDFGQDPNPGLIDFDGGQSIYGACGGTPGSCPPGVSDPEGDGVANKDPQCGVPWRQKEKIGCGLGVELAVLLPLLTWRRRLH